MKNQCTDHFLEAGFLATVFFAAGFLATGFFEAGFLVTGFLVTGFLEATFFFAPPSCMMGSMMGSMS